jgi:alpha-galactosidase
MRAAAIAIALLWAATLQAQKYDGLARTPPMGWNSWNRFGCDVSERLVRETADAMIASGMRDAGYRYVVIDDCWHGARDSLGFIHPDTARFPSGMRALADYVHERGLKLGIYSDAGRATCGGRPGSQGHEYQDALQYARWGVDYLKYDWCATNGRNAPEAYRTMRDALAAAGRPIVLAICEWGDNRPWEWAKDVGHLWRTTGDITACWDCERNQGTWSSWGILRILDRQKALRAHAGPDRWNDPDMLEVGNGMSATEDRAHFAMWAMLAAPLLAGNDLRTMSPATRELLANREVVAIDQDSLGIPGFPYLSQASGVELWLRPLADGDWAMAILNRGDATRRVVFDFAREWVADGLSRRETRFAERSYRIRDLWAHADAGTTARALELEVAPHDVRIFRLVAQSPDY